MRIAVALAVGLAVLAGSPALAQTEGAARSAARVDVNRAAPSARSLALSQRLLVAMDAQKNSEAVMKSIGEATIQTGPTQMPEAERRRMHETFEAAMRTVLPDMFTRMTILQAQVYSEAELDALVAFYESPVGRSVTRKTAELGPGMTAVMVEFAPRIQAEMTTRICAAEGDDASGMCAALRSARAQ